MLRLAALMALVAISSPASSGPSVEADPRLCLEMLDLMAGARVGLAASLLKDPGAVNGLSGEAISELAVLASTQDQIRDQAVVMREFRNRECGE